MRDGIGHWWLMTKNILFWSSGHTFSLVLQGAATFGYFGLLSALESWLVIRAYLLTTEEPYNV